MINKIHSWIGDVSAWRCFIAGIMLSPLSANGQIKSLEVGTSPARVTAMEISRSSRGTVGCYNHDDIAPVVPLERPVIAGRRSLRTDRNIDSRSLNGLKLALDSGHGGDAHPSVENGWEPGATSPFFDLFQVSDFLFNYEASEEIARILRERGAVVELFRYPQPGGYGYETKEKGRRAEGADIFISLHHNAFTDFVQGSEVFTPPSPQLGDRQLAFAIQDELIRQIWNGNKSFDRGVKSASFVVLNGAAEAKVPAVVLVESFFIHNKEPIETLVDRRDRAALAIADGVTKYWLSQ